MQDLLNQITTKYGQLAGQVFRFAMVGVINTGIDFLILNILMAITNITSGSGLIPLNIISFALAVINSYFLNKKWAFKDPSSGDNTRKFSIFLLVSVLGALINTSVLTAFTSGLDPMFGLSSVLWANVGKILATGISLVWNFIGYKLFVFKR